MISPFHLALSVRNLDETRHFYGTMLQCREGRSAPTWIDFDLFGHQLSFHMLQSEMNEGYNPVDGDNVPIPHFGVILPWQQWHDFRDRLISEGIRFEIEPTIRFKGLAGEQATMFFRDPSGNALEFKSFKNQENLFATDSE
jgi:hypothetical protein